METAKQTRFIESFTTMTLQAEQISNLNKHKYWTVLTVYRVYESLIVISICTNKTIT